MTAPAHHLADEAKREACRYADIRDRELEQRIERLEQLLMRLCDTLGRMGTMRDGNWGYPSCRNEFAEIAHEVYEGMLARQEPPK